MEKLGLFQEEDEKGELTGRWQVAGEDDDAIVYDTFDTEEAAEKARVRLQATFDRNDKITAEYLKWEKDCLARHEISESELREYLVNVVIL